MAGVGWWRGTCAARQPRGPGVVYRFACDRPRWHRGPHLAWNGRGQLLAVWDRR